MSVARCGQQSRLGEPRDVLSAWINRTVPLETATTRRVPKMGEVQSAPASGSSVSSVCCVPSSVSVSGVPREVALRMSERKRTVELRTTELRSVAFSTVALAYPPAPPKDALSRVFRRIKRAARTEKSLRISERLATNLGSRSLVPLPAFSGASKSGQVRVKSMQFEESAWRSLHDVVSAVLAATRDSAANGADQVARDAAPAPAGHTALDT